MFVKIYSFVHSTDTQIDAGNRAVNKTKSLLSNYIVETPNGKRPSWKKSMISFKLRMN